MQVTKQDVVNTLSVHEPADLIAILEVARVPQRDAETPRELAERITDALWWNYCTPMGYLADRTHLDDIVKHVTRRLRIQDRVLASDPWDRLSEMTAALALDVREGFVGFDDLQSGAQARLQGSWMPTLGFAGGAGSSAGAGAASRLVLKFAKTPVGRLIPFIPTIGPVFSGITTGAGVVSIVAWPLTVALGVLALNQSLGHQLSTHGAPAAGYRRARGRTGGGGRRGARGARP